MKNTYETGLAGESGAEEWLREKRGMQVLERRLRTKAGEVDLVMLEGDTVVFVEVKTRMKAAPGQGMLAVNAAKQRRIVNAAMLYLMKKRWLNRPVRFDVVEVRPGTVTHVPNAFQMDNGMFFEKTKAWEGEDDEYDA